MATVPVSVLYKKMFLRVLFEQCKKNFVSLPNALLTAAASAVESSGRDVVMTGTAANGASVSYSLTAQVNFVPARHRVELLEELLEVYEAVIAAFPELKPKRNAGTPPSVEDGAIVEKMLAAYGRGKRSLALDFGGLQK